MSTIIPATQEDRLGAYSEERAAPVKRKALMEEESPQYTHSYSSGWVLKLKEPDKYRNLNQQSVYPEEMSELLERLLKEKRIRNDSSLYFLKDKSMAIHLAYAALKIQPVHTGGLYTPDCVVVFSKITGLFPEQIINESMIPPAPFENFVKIDSVKRKTGCVSPLWFKMINPGEENDDKGKVIESIYSKKPKRIPASDEKKTEHIPSEYSMGYTTRWVSEQGLQEKELREEMIGKYGKYPSEMKQDLVQLHRQGIITGKELLYFLRDDDSTIYLSYIHLGINPEDNSRFHVIVYSKMDGLISGRKIAERYVPSKDPSNPFIKIKLMDGRPSIYFEIIPDFPEKRVNLQMPPVVPPRPLERMPRIPPVTDSLRPDKERSTQEPFDIASLEALVSANDAELRALFNGDDRAFDAEFDKELGDFFPDFKE